MSKNIYEMLNDSDIDLDEYEKEEFNDIEKGKMKKNFRHAINKKNRYKKSKVVAVVAVGVMVLLFGTNTGNQVLASINMFGSDIASRLGIESNLEEYKTVVDKLITKDGITIQLNEVILDVDELIVSSTIKSNDEKIGEYGIHGAEDIYINGKSVSSGGGGSSKVIDEYTVEQIMKYKLDEDDFSGDLDVRIIYKNIFTGEEATKNGPWKFEFKTNGDELALDTKEIGIEHKFTLDNGNKVTIEKYTSNSLGQKIYYKKTGKENEYDIKLVGLDDLGNKVEFWTSNSEPSKGMLTREDLDLPFSSEAKLITLTPYAVEYPKESGRMNSDFKQIGEEFTIELK